MHETTRLTQLRQKLHQHCHAYYVLAAPTISDAEYDTLFRELQELEAKHPEMADPNSPTARIGAMEISSFEKVKHRVPMLSLDNAFSAQEVLQFFHSRELDGPLAHEFVAEPKIDGLALSLTYEFGNLTRAVTRGNGETGDDVTANARVIKSIPLVLSSQVNVEVRGEVYMTTEAFKRLNAQREADGDELMANPRNAAAGSMKLKNPAEVSRRGLNFFAYQAIFDPDFSRNVTTYFGMLNALQDFGFCTQSAYSVSSVASSVTFFEGLRAKLPYDIDGIVFKINSLKKREELGMGTRSPKWAVAYKFPAEQKITKLLGIAVQVGRTGTLTPVANLAPVQIGGVVVRNASLCNQDEVERLEVSVGDDVIVARQGDVIPKVVGVKCHNTAGFWKMPEACPCCGTAVKKDEGMVAYYCPNFNCADQVFARLKHALAKGALDWDGMGDAAIRDVMTHNKLAKLSDLFAFTAEDIRHLFKPAMARKFSKERERVKGTPLWRKLHALGVEGVGQTSCKELAARFSSLEEMITAPEVVRQVVGPVASRSFVEYLSANVDEIVRLETLGFKFEAAKGEGGPLTGKVFVITGAMLSGTRDVVAQRIEAAGGLVKASVGKGTSYLVHGDGAGHNKSEAAERLGIPVIDEEALYRMMGQAMPAAAITGEERDY
jgi:DNA ligase (NAD+)